MLMLLLLLLLLFVVLSLFVFRVCFFIIFNLFLVVLDFQGFQKNTSAHCDALPGPPKVDIPLNAEQEKQEL